jgi:hypothetical protein
VRSGRVDVLGVRACDERRATSGVRRAAEACGRAAGAPPLEK